MLLSNFKKYITSKGFVLCIVFSVVLLLSAEIYIDPVTYNRYSVIRSLTDFTEEERIRIGREMCSIQIVSNALNSWFTLFVPITTAFCFVPIMCKEREENALRFQIFRSKKVAFNASRFLAGIVSGGLAATLGYLLFSGAVMLLFPSLSDFSETTAQHIREWSTPYPRQLLSVFCYTVYWGIPPMLLSSVLQNKYLIMCLPFFLRYGIKQFYYRTIQSVVYGDYNENLVSFVTLIDPEAILWVSKENLTEVLAVFGGLAVAFFVAYLVITTKRSDCGA